MEIPGSGSWEFFDVDSYRRAREAAGAPLPVASPQAPSGPAAAGAKDLAGQLADLRLGRAERHRASDAGAALAPRNAPPGIGGSMRLPAQAAAALVGRDNHFHSTRRLYVPESPPDSPEPYDAPQPAHRSGAHSSYATCPDAASRRSGSFMSGLTKSLSKGFKKAFSRGSSSKDFSSTAGFAPSRHSVDSSCRGNSTLRMDAHSPGRELARTVTEEDAANAQGTWHDSSPAEMPAPQPARAPRRRRRDEEADAIRRVATSAMHATQTTLPRPDPASRKTPHSHDSALLQRAKAGLQMSARRLPHETFHGNLRALTEFSAWLKQVGKDPMQGRLFSPELLADAHKFADVGGPLQTPSALGHLREMESSSSGVANIPRHERRRSKAVPAADQALIERAFEAGAGTDRNYRAATRTFSEWLAENGYPALTDPIVDGGGLEIGRQLHSDDVMELANEYLSSPGAQYKNSLIAALKQLRTFDLKGATNLKRNSSHFGIPEADARLLARYRIEANKAAAATNKPLKVGKRGSTSVDENASNARAFSDWLQKQGRPSITARLHDGTLWADLELFVDRNSSRFRHIRGALNGMIALFPPEDPGVTFGRVGHAVFVKALGTLALSPDISVENTAIRVGADVDDLLVFLDARSADGLTEAGRALVKTFDGPALQEASANIALRRQMMVMAAAQGAGTAPGQALPPLHATPVGWSQISWSDVAETPRQDFGPAGSMHSGAHEGGHAFDLNTPSEEAQRERTDSAYAGLSSFASVPGYEGPGAYARPPSEVTGPYRPAPEVVDVDDHPSPQGERAAVAQRLANPTAWLRSDDIWNYSQAFLESFARQLGPGGRERIDRTIGIGDPSVLAQHLMNGTARQRDAVRAQLTAPTLLLPVNNPHNHWSLLVVHRDAQQATHYDSKIPPDQARCPAATATPQFALARRMAAALGVSTVGTMPMAMQPDDHSCGDHVLAGIDELARRLVNRQGGFSWDLSGIRPSRQDIVATLTGDEQPRIPQHPGPHGQPPRVPDLGYVVGREWLHGDHYASPELTHALAMEGALPTPYMPRTALQIRGERYLAHLVDGAVLLSWTPAPDAELPHGYAAIDRDTLLGRIGAQMGHASGQGLNCLLDSIVQLARSTPRQARPMPALDRQVQRMRDMLTTVGAIEQRGEIDVYERENAGALLAANFSVRLQFIQEDEHRRVFVHPVIGQDGPLVRILHTPGHFQPLWPSGQR